jgi:hypothetical protein
VIVLADGADPGGLRRHVIADGERKLEILPTEDSASVATVRELLSFMVENYPAERYGIVFLDHGGGLDEMCLDRRPDAKRKNAWLSARKTGEALRKFRKEVRKKGESDVELLFLQQCGRGSIENLYNFRGAARAVVASQGKMGAPNDYYRATFFRLGRKPETKAFDVADGILWDEEQFITLVCVDGEKLAELPKRLDPVVAELLAAESPKAPDDAALCFRGNYRKDETTYDLLHWLERAYAASKVPEEKAKAGAAFRAWVEKELIVHFRRHPLKRRQVADWTGLGLFVPEAVATRERYAGYPLYEASRLPDLLKKLYPEP